MDNMDNIKDILDNHKLNFDDYENIKTALNRVPNSLEIGIFAAMWSEHCSYKSSKIYLKNFPTSAPHVIQGPGENAGIIDIGDGMAAVFKIESHNHPSFIEPYSGAATGVGGILRDIFTMGARPVANLNSIRFGNIMDSSQSKLHKYLVRRVSAGIGDYGNCMGIPTIGGESSFEDCYNGNILVNAFSLGLVKKDAIFYSKASGEGNVIIYAGSKTGRDGLGGAVMSSNSFDEDSNSLKPTIQVGDPFSEKLLMEACMELFNKNLVVGIQDMGAAGLTSSSFEMAFNSNSGMRLYLDKVPTRENNMTPYELMLSESQERMLICADKEHIDVIIDIFNKWEVDVSVIGEVTTTGCMELFFNKNLVANIPVKSIVNAAPQIKREVRYPKYLNEINNVNIGKMNKSQNDVFKILLSSVDISDKNFIYNQFDSTVMTNTIIGCGKGDASVIRVKENGVKLTINLYCNPRYCYLNPKEGAKIAVATSGRNCSTRGGKPLAITDCLNFGSPENPEVMWQFKEVCDGIKEACEVLRTPVVSGNVSLYNQTNGIDIYPTPSIGMVGIIDKNSRVLDSALKYEGNLIVLLGSISEDIGGSLYLKLIYNSISLQPPVINLDLEYRLWQLLRDSSEFIVSAKSVKEGGLAIAISKMALLGNKGVNVNTGFNNAILLFSETQSMACVEINSNDFDKLNSLAKKYSISCKVIGNVGNKYGMINIDDINISSKEAADLYFNSFSNLFT